MQRPRPRLVLHSGPCSRVQAAACAVARRRCTTGCVRRRSRRARRGYRASGQAAAAAMSWPRRAVERTSHEASDVCDEAVDNICSNPFTRIGYYRIIMSVRNVYLRIVPCHQLSAPTGSPRPPGSLIAQFGDHSSLLSPSPLVLDVGDVLDPLPAADAALLLALVHTITNITLTIFISPHQPSRRCSPPRPLSHGRRPPATLAPSSCMVNPRKFCFLPPSASVYA
ncbi:hypothetical protein C8Q77DRAFT_52735 [Trametes polyzona]|nr:hypothetical protein C8Q77DRAFT_52735 [Trametes polyzona]